MLNQKLYNINIFGLILINNIYLGIIDIILLVPVFESTLGFYLVFSQGTIAFGPYSALKNRNSVMYIWLFSPQWSSAIIVAVSTMVTLKACHVKDRPNSVPNTSHIAYISSVNMETIRMDSLKGIVMQN